MVNIPYTNNNIYILYYCKQQKIETCLNNSKTKGKMVETCIHFAVKFQKQVAGWYNKR